MPWEADRNWGRCAFHTCNVTFAPRCDGFFCAGCCRRDHITMVGHRQPDGTITGSPMTPDSRLPALYGGTDQKKPHEPWCKCVSCRDWEKTHPPEYDYDTHPAEDGEIKELETDYDRVFVPLGNFRANKDWPADYVG